MHNKGARRQTPAMGLTSCTPTPALQAFGGPPKSCEPSCRTRKTGSVECKRPFRLPTTMQFAPERVHKPSCLRPRRDTREHTKLPNNHDTVRQARKTKLSMPARRPAPSPGRATSLKVHVGQGLVQETPAGIQNPEAVQLPLAPLFSSSEGIRVAREGNARLLGTQADAIRSHRHRQAPSQHDPTGELSWRASRWASTIQASRPSETGLCDF